MTPLTIRRIQIQNLAGLTEFDATLPAVTLIEAGNGKGKTSLLSAIKYAFDRGHDPDMIHANADWGKITLHMSDSSAIEARASKTTNTTTRGYKAPGATRFVFKRDEIDRIVNAVSYDPLSFMGMKPAEQVAQLLKVLPCEVPAEALAEAVGDVADESFLRGITPGMNGLQALDVVASAVYAKRTEIHVAADTQKKHAAALRDAIGASSDEKDWTAEVTRIEAAKSDNERLTAEEMTVIRDEFDNARNAENKTLTEAVDALRAKASEQIERLRAIANSKAQELRTKTDPVAGRLITELATAKERQLQTAKSAGTKEAAEKAQQQADAGYEMYQRMTDALRRLATLKADTAAQLPIKDVVFKDGRIMRWEEGGKPCHAPANHDEKVVGSGPALVPFGQWNTSDQIIFCLRVAVIAHGEAGFIIIDNAEHLDAERRAGMVRAAKKYAEEKGLQFIIAAVTEGELKVEGA